MNLINYLADKDNDDAPVIVHGDPIDNGTRWAMPVTNYGLTPGGVWVGYPLAADGLSVVSQPQPRSFGASYSTLLTAGQTLTIASASDALNYLRCQVGVVASHPFEATMYQDTANTFSDLTQTLITQEDAELQTDGKYRMVLLVDLTWRYVRATVRNTSGSTMTAMKAQISFSGVR